jgi:4-hydroxy-4-methyl-2-oxoglutarate aldolase
MNDDFAELAGFDSPTIANAMELLGLRDRTDGYIGGSIRCQFPTLRSMVARALTVTMTSRPGPPASRTGYWQMWEALWDAPRPSVLVVQDLSGAPTRVAYVGEVMATLAKRLGCVGFVTDAGVRDLAEVEALGLHLFAPHAVVSHGNFEIVEVGVEVTLDGQRVRPGDILHGDRHGIVLIPDGALASLGGAVETVRQGEAELLEFIRSPQFDLSEARRRAGY